MARKRKPDNERLMRCIQVSMTEHEFKIMDRIRRQLSYATNSAYVRAVILEKIKKQMQAELF